jgi:uncharacterized repeat protein (TIGR01451 family)
MKKIALLMVALACTATAAHAQGPEAEALRVTASNRTAATEAERGAPRSGDEARPGDVVRYTLAFRNVAGRPIQGVVLANPVAEGTRFVAGSASSTRADARLEYSADGGRTFSPRPTVEVVEDGRRIQRAAAPEQYTHVRWIIDGTVAPDAAVTAQFEVRLGAPAGEPAPSAGAAAAPGGR